MGEKFTEQTKQMAMLAEVKAISPEQRQATEKAEADKAAAAATVTNTMKEEAKKEEKTAEDKVKKLKDEQNATQDAEKREELGKKIKEVSAGAAKAKAKV